MATVSSRPVPARDLLRGCAVMPVLVVEDAELAAPLARALAAGGVMVCEVTLRTAAALDAIVAMKQAVPEMIVGVGTVRVPADVARSVAVGADFLVTPGTTPALAAALAGAGVPALPGVGTASDVMARLDEGFDVLKFFPAERAGGLKALADFAGPFPEALFCPTGGIGEAQAPAYLAARNVVAVGGSWVATREAVAARDWAAIEANAARATAMLKP